MVYLLLYIIRHEKKHLTYVIFQTKKSSIQKPTNCGKYKNMEIGYDLSASLCVSICVCVLY